MSIHCCGGNTRLQKYPPHTHARWEIVSLLEGEAEVQTEEHCYALVAGDILLIPPHVTRRGRSEHGFRDIALRADGISFYREAHLHDTTGEIATLMQMISRTLTEQKEEHLAVAEGLTQAVAAMIRQLLGATCSPMVEAFKSLLYQNLSVSTFSLTDAISETGYVDDHFRKRFRKETGKTPLQYLTELRLTHAKNLLSSKNDLRIETVAEACGFSDAFYFSRCFKKHFGRSPLDYKKNSAKQNVQRHHHGKADAKA